MREGHKTLQSSPFFVITNEGKQDCRNPGPAQEKKPLVPNRPILPVLTEGRIKAGALTCIKNQTLKKKKYLGLERWLGG